ncbi:PIF1-like helicase domain-containing protein [Hirsutella rhossiliensis]|uniref:ATP-dependent DNA helicase n=1 Tax=Hirsutella rhossiliensis TaxID=111463 RepID=A0A9P8N3S5_9HYPO|nr:PIF1-like helicase domain-containing protein [Hirsutella rhossiliensis]KAH0966294.1 PIF1-like helicase domain-containing protein [Hirsutella rhossiliensis]
MKRNSLKICSRCIGRDRKKALDEPYFFSAANNLDFGEVPGNLPDLTMVEEMLIARIHVHVKVLQVRGAQYKYRGHVIHFLRNIGRLFEELPVLPKELDIVLLRPPNMEGDPRFQQQFARDFRRHHPGYRDIVIPQGPVEEALEEDPCDADASAIPNLQVTDTELNALQSRVLDVALTLSMPLPSIRRTPIDEFNRSQPLLSLAFPTLYPDGKADFVEPRLRSITYQDYLGHAMRWHDGRFARHKTWPFVALNTLLQEAMAEPDEPEAQDLIQSITRQAAVIRGTRPPGLFVTAKWKAAPEAARMVLSRQLLRDNAHIAAYHFYKRYTLLTTIVLKQKFNLTDLWGRYEWGGRNDGQINHYNRLLTVAWLANTDVSPCTSLQQVIDYAAKYCSKSEKKSESFAQIGKALMPRVKDHNPLISFTSKLLNQLVAERDYSKQEVSHLLLGLPLQEGSRICLYVDCRHPDRHSRSLRIDGDEVDEAPNVYEKYGQRPEALKDLTYVSFLKHWNFRSRDPSAWKQWRPGNVNGRPRQQWPDYCRAFSYCWQHHNHGDDHYGQPKEARLQPQDDQYEALPEVLDLLGRRDIDVNYDWTRHVGTYPELRDGYWKDLIASHPMANDVEVLGPQWRNTLNPQQRLVYDTFMGHFQARNPTQILLHVDGGGGTGKSFLIKVLSSHLQAAALPNPSPICRVAPTGVASNQIQGSTIHSLLRLPVGGAFTDLPPADAAALQSRLRHVKYLVIDEKSMLGIEQLARIDSRLRQAFPQRSLEFFGGHQPVFVGKERQVAYRLFDRTVFLTTVQRQAGDDQAQFRRALQELRESRLTQSEVDSFRAALRVYSTRARVEAKNQGKGAGQAPSDNAGNLSNKFLLLRAPGKISPILPSLTKEQIVTDLATRDFQAGISYVAVSRVTSLQGLLLEAPFDRQSLYNHTPTEGMKMRLADQQRRQGQQLSDAPYPPLYLD